MVKAVIGLVLAGAAGAAHGAATTQPTAPPGYRLVWDEEFDKDGPVDATKWAYEAGMLRNHEAQFYTDGRKENARVDRGNLVIEARREDASAPPRKGEKAGRAAGFTSASIYSKASWQYGRVEVRAKVPVARGTWPAIWFLGDDIRHGAGWPRCGEIDLMEAVGYDPTRIHQSIHTEAYNWVQHTQKTAITPVKDLADAFHVYTLEWTPERVDMFLDGGRKFTFANEHKGVAGWPFDQPIHLKLNLAVGGDWGGQKGIDDNAFPQRFLIDYVRVYQKAEK